MPPSKQFFVLPNGEKIELFYISYLARYIGRTVQTVKNWEARSVIPPAFFHDSRGCRLYSQEMCDVLKKAVMMSEVKRGRSFAYTPISAMVYREWEKLRRKYAGEKKGESQPYYNRKE